jgi:hypothetical protein
MLNIDELWHSTSNSDWQFAMDNYWTFVKPANLQLEKEMEALNSYEIETLDQAQWYDFLLKKYFPWKYTAVNRLATTTAHLRKYAESNNLGELYEIKKKVFECDKEDIGACLNAAYKIKGLGPAGASGLLAVLFPRHFGTADQFVVKALCSVTCLPESEKIHKMKPENLTPKHAALLVQVMRTKSSELNALFSSDTWTPRKVDMILWTFGRN